MTIRQAENTFRYRVGTTSTATASRPAAGWRRRPGARARLGGAGRRRGDRRSRRQPRPELIFMAYDNPARRTISAIRSAGTSTRRHSRFWTATPRSRAWAGKARARRGDRPDRRRVIRRSDMILVVYDNPAQANTFRYKSAWTSESNGACDLVPDDHRPRPRLGGPGRRRGARQSRRQSPARAGADGL